MSDTAADAEIQWVQMLVDRIVAEEPTRPRPTADSGHEPAGPAGMLEKDALRRVDALDRTPSVGDVLIGILFLDTGDTVLIGARAVADADGEPVVVDWRAPSVRGSSSARSTIHRV